MFSHATNQKTLCYLCSSSCFFVIQVSLEIILVISNGQYPSTLQPAASQVFFHWPVSFFGDGGCSWMFLIFPSSWWTVHFLANSIGRSSSLKSHSKFCFGSFCFTLWWFSWWIRDSELHFNTETLPIWDGGNAGARGPHWVFCITSSGTISFTNGICRGRSDTIEGTVRVKRLNWFSKLKCIIHYLVGGFNPFEKYQSNRIISPNRGENIFFFETTT